MKHANDNDLVLGKSTLNREPFLPKRCDRAVCVMIQFPNQPRTIPVIRLDPQPLTDGTSDLSSPLLLFSRHQAPAPSLVTKLQLGNANLRSSASQPPNTMDRYRISANRTKVETANLSPVFSQKAVSPRFEIKYRGDVLTTEQKTGFLIKSLNQ